MYEAATAFAQAGRSRAALRTYRELIRRFEASPADHELVARARLSSAIPLALNGRVGEALAALDEVRDDDLLGERARELRDALAAAEAEDTQVMSEEEDWAHGVIAHGCRLGEEGRLDEAVRVLEQVPQRFGAADYDALQSVVTNAVYNLGIVAREDGRPEDAIAAFDRVLSGFPDADGPSLRAQRALTLFNKGVVLRDLDQGPEALAVLHELIDRFSADNAPFVRERVARAQYISAAILWERKEIRQATALRAAILRRHDEPALRELVETVRAEQRELLPRVEPARHAEHSPTSRWLAAEHHRAARLRCGLPAIPPLIAAVLLLTGLVPLPSTPVAWTLALAAVATWGAYWGRLIRVAKSFEDRIPEFREIDRRTDDTAAELHAATEEILERYRHDGTPFALFLRNFELEARMLLGSRRRAGIGLRHYVKQSYDESAMDFENRLAHSLRDRIPLVGMANPMFDSPHLRHAIPKLAVDGRRWQDVLHRLVLAADLIIMDLTHLSDGVVTELELIRSAGAADATIVVLPAASSGEQTGDDGDALMDYFTTRYGLAEPDHVAATPDSEVLAGFTRVVREDAIDLDDLLSGMTRPVVLGSKPDPAS